MKASSPAPEEADSFGYNSFGKVVGELNGPNNIYAKNNIH
jgi:hypothetical protein